MCHGGEVVAATTGAARAMLTGAGKAMNTGMCVVKQRTNSMTGEAMMIGIAASVGQAAVAGVVLWPLAMQGEAKGAGHLRMLQHAVAIIHLPTTMSGSMMQTGVAQNTEAEAEVVGEGTAEILIGVTLAPTLAEMRVEDQKVLSRLATAAHMRETTGSRSEQDRGIVADVRCAVGNRMLMH